MATCDHPTDLVDRLAYPSFGRPGLRIDPRLSVRPTEEEKQPLVSAGSDAIEADDTLFAASLIASGKPPRRNPWAAVGSLTFEFLVLAAVIIVPLLYTEPLPKRLTLTTLYLQPPPAAGASSARVQAPQQSSTYNPINSIPRPMHTTDEAPAPAPVGAPSGVVGGVPGALAGGIPTGVFTEVNSAPKAPVLAAKLPEQVPVKRIRVASRVAEANLIHDVPPHYPEEAGRARLEGTVVLMALIGKDGSVEDVRVESGSTILVQAAIDAVKQWRYKPYLVDGEPFEVDSRITINFKLSGA